MKKRIFIPRKGKSPRFAVLDEVNRNVKTRRLNSCKPNLSLGPRSIDEDDYTGFEDCDGDLDFYARNVDSNIGFK